MGSDRAPRHTSVPYARPSDFDLMTGVVTASWLTDRPLVSCTVGDLEWWTVNDPGQVLEGQAELWLEDGVPVGWAWPDPPTAADWHLRSGVPRAPFLAPLLDRLETQARNAAAASESSTFLDVDGRRREAVPTATTTWAMDADREAVDVLLARGYRPDGMALSMWVRRLPAGGGEPVPERPLPLGYRHASVRWPEDLAKRVEVHRSAFAPSRMTLEKYLRLAGVAHYDPERDRVIVGPDGTFAAFANGWLDPVARVGELEPVGTHADHRRLGLGQAVCWEAMRSRDEAGAEVCVIDSFQGNAASEALYESLGCSRATTIRRYARPLGPARPGSG
jgi:mycothiol synthase